MTTVFLSDAIHQERLIFAPGPRPDGTRGWKALSARYQASLELCHYRVQRVVRPEIYQTDWARQALGVASGDWHLAVKPIEHLRPFHGLPNVFVCDWPFPELSASPLDGSPFFDQVRMLKLADAVVCCTGYTAGVLRSFGIERVVTLPPWVAAGPARPPRPPPPPEDCCNFLCIVDVDHLPSQLGLAIEGFTQAGAQRAGLGLVIHVLGGDEQSASELRQQAGQQAAPGRSIRVVAGDASGLAEALAAADFVLSANASAGLQLPLVEAMLAGIPLVTPMAGCAASFVPAAAAVPIATQRDPRGASGEPIGRLMALTGFAATAEAIRDAVLAAAALDAPVRRQMADAGRQAAEQRFGAAAFQAGLARLGQFVAMGPA